MQTMIFIVSFSPQWLTFPLGFHIDIYNNLTYVIYIQRKGLLWSAQTVWLI